MPDSTEPASSLASQYKTASEHWQRQWAALERERDTLRDALIAARYHLDFCGYGDTYERDCARESKLEETIKTALKET